MGNLQIAMGMKLAVVVAIVLSVWSLAVAMEESSDAMDKLVDRAANSLPSHLSDDQIQMFTRLLQQKLKQRGNDNAGAENDLGESARTERILLTNTCLKFMPNIRIMATTQAECPKHTLECPKNAAAEAAEDAMHAAKDEAKAHSEANAKAKVSSAQGEGNVKERAKKADAQLKTAQAESKTANAAHKRAAKAASDAKQKPQLVVDLGSD